MISREMELHEEFLEVTGRLARLEGAGKGGFTPEYMELQEELHRIQREQTALQRLRRPKYKREEIEW